MSRRGARIHYIGHATVLLEIDGVCLLTDPVLRPRITFLQRHLPLPPLDYLYRNVDAVLISHVHHDHLDLPSLNRLGKTRRLIVPAGTAKWLARKGFTNVEELRRDQTTTVGPVEVVGTYSAHDPHRHRFGWRAEASLGYLIQGSQTIYFAGDTGLFDEMANFAGMLDLSLLPVWGWGPTLGPGHLNPRTAAEALSLLQPKYAIPIHWGTLRPLGMGILRIRPAFLSVPPFRFASFAAEIAPAVQVKIVPLGGEFILPAPDQV